MSAYTQEDFYVGEIIAQESWEREMWALGIDPGSEEAEELASG